MDTPLSAPVETYVRRCPSCLSEVVVPLGRVVAAGLVIRCAYHCRDCSKEFAFLR